MSGSPFGWLYPTADDLAAPLRVTYSWGTFRQPWGQPPGPTPTEQVHRLVVAERAKLLGADSDVVDALLDEGFPGSSEDLAVVVEGITC